MSSFRLHLAALVAAAGLAASGCAASTQPTFNVLSVQKRNPNQVGTPARRDMVVYVEVVNPARRPIKLQKLQYTFASAGAPTARGEVELGARLVAAGAAVVVEVPLLAGMMPVAGETLTLAGRLFAEQDRIVRSFAVEAELAAPVERDAP